jgi:hypothetical protein
MASKKSRLRGINVTLKSDKAEEVKIRFIGEMFTPFEFKSIFMGVLEAYTLGLIEQNGNDKVFEHWNAVFGKFLTKIVPEKTILEKSEAHKNLKEAVEVSLEKEETLTTARNNETNRVAAMILAKEILLDAGLEEKSVDVLINKKIGLITPNKPN